MQINPIHSLSVNNKKQNQSFKAILVGMTQPDKTNPQSQIEIYRLEKKDKPVMEKMLENIDLRELTKNEHHYIQYKNWQELIDLSVSDIGTEYTVLLAVNNKKPCGIASHTKITKFFPGHTLLANIATWPKAYKEKVPYAGQSIMRQVFEDFKKSGTEHIQLSPYTPLRGYRSDFYPNLGFEPQEGTYKQFILKKPRLEESIKNLDSVVNYSKIKEEESIDLEPILDLKY